MKRAYDLIGMHCSACVSRLQKALADVAGVSEVEVRLRPPQAIVESSAKIDLARLAAAVSAAGDYQIRGVTDARPGQVDAVSEKKLTVYYPLILLITLVAMVAALIQWRAADFHGREWMADFMGGFFVAFSFFKLLDVGGFADAFQQYDLIAAKSRAYAIAYPFIELVLGIAYLARWSLTFTNVATLALMLVGSCGVLRGLRRSQEIPCACLGTAFNLPMSTVTLVEDLGMAAMAAAMLAV